VRCAAVDETRLFPQDCQLIELLDETREQNEAALIEEFANRHIDIRTGKMGERWVAKPPPPPEFETKVMSALDAIMSRLEKLEGK
jgi:hypothetical protein